MILIVAKFTIKAGEEENFLALTRELVKTSNKEKGCVEYSLHKDVKKELTYCMLEKWKDQAAIDEHNNSSHFTSILPQIGQIAAVEVDIYQPA